MAAKPRRKNASARKSANDNPHPAGGRPAWRGQLRLSLVSCPVMLISATTRAHDISFHLLNPETNNRIRMIPTDPDTGPVERSDLVKGYEISRDEYVVVTNEELDEVRLETTHTLNIERFVDAGSIDRLYWNDPYFLMPDGEDGLDAYTVIRDAMARAGRIALGRVVMYTRERLLAIEPRGNGLLAYSLRMNDEVVDPDPMFANISAAGPDKKMIAIAQKIIDQHEGPFRPEDFKDRYEMALRDLIRRKRKGQKPVSAPPPEQGNVIDLMEALRKSVKAKSRPASSPAPARKTKARKRSR